MCDLAGGKKLPTFGECHCGNACIIARLLQELLRVFDEILDHHGGAEGKDQVFIVRVQ